jgi:hypothetical protein
VASNGHRVRLWRLELQQLADEWNLTVHICHSPPGTSKWKKIEHRMFCHITANWRRRPLINRQVFVSLNRMTMLWISPERRGSDATSL